jgi:hypothetical protein
MGVRLSYNLRWVSQHHEEDDSIHLPDTASRMTSLKNSHINPHSQKVASSNHPTDPSANNGNPFRRITHDCQTIVWKRGNKGVETPQRFPLVCK